MQKANELTVAASPRTAAPNPVRVGIVGYGTVGKATAEILTANSEEIARRIGVSVLVTRICRKSPQSAEKGVNGLLVTCNWQDVVFADDVDIVVEAVGGTDVALQVLRAALENGKAVVTANKALLAQYGEELFTLAKQNNLPIGIEASVAGGVPVIRAISEALAADRIQAIYGIVNGTSNHILTQMEQRGIDFNEALEQAQRAGYAEADPSLDIDGVDARDNPEEKYAWVEPGVPLDHLRHRANQYNLTFGPDPSTHEYCNLGGMLGNNSCGVHSMMAGRTVDNTHELEILTYDGERLRVGPTTDSEIEQIIIQGGRRGEIYRKLRALRDTYAELIRRRYPKIPRRVSGYSLDELLPENGFNVARALVGSESTCAITLRAKLRLVYWPPKRSLLVLGYPSVYEAGDHIPEIRESHPIGLEGMDDVLIENMKKKKLHPENTKILPEGKGWLLCEFGGETKQEADAKAHELMARLRRHPNAPSMKLFDDQEEESKVWKTRESGLGATARVPGEPDTWEGWEDSAVPPEKLGQYLRELRKLFEKHGYNCALYGHFGQACVHTRIDFDLVTSTGIANYRSFVEEAADIVVKLGGSLSGEHGDGQSRGELLVKMFGPELMEAMREFKRIWDPEWKMNPGKKIDAYPLDVNLRLGTDYSPPRVKTNFFFPEENGDFARATTRCVGVGKCRKDEQGTMCPSYMATKEEMHSTRGRTHLLFEMLQGDPMKGGWKSDHVHEALDLCLACKACKGECPLNVDMATYKAEFLSHYYEDRLRPRHAYSMGWIYWWARLARFAPELVNLAGELPLISNLVKWIGGIAQQRRMPKFATQTFTDWFRARGVRNQGKPKVMLWPDTFNNHFHPPVAKAAVEVLEHAGYQVIIPRVSLCCGRPLYDFGMLDTAKMMLLQILDELRPHIAAGTPLIGLEPSCVSVFRDEMINLLAHNQDAQRLSEQTFLLSEFLIKKADYHPPQLQHKAIVHGHCHHKSILKFDSEQELLKRMGLDFKVLDSGCCGMAGSFGFEEGKFEISKQIGERVLLPAVRQASRDTLIIADGFSCNEQIDGLAGRQSLHISEVLQMAIAGEEGISEPAPTERHAARTAVATVVGASAVAAGAALYFSLRATHNGHGRNGASHNGHGKASEKSNVKELQPR